MGSRNYQDLQDDAKTGMGSCHRFLRGLKVDERIALVRKLDVRIIRFLVYPSYRFLVNWKLYL